MQRTLLPSSRVRALGAAAIAIVALLGTALPGSAATTYALPGAPASVTAKPAPGGVFVQWTAGKDGSSPVTSYTVTGGPGTCAVVVDGSQYSAFVPAVAGQSATKFSVIATNALGSSDAGVTATEVTAAMGAGARVLGTKGGAAVVGAGDEIASGVRSVVAAASTRDGQGYWTIDADGVVSAAGSAEAIGGAVENAVALVPAANDRGLIVVSKNGVVTSLGDANINRKLPAGAAVVGAAGTADGKGAWIVRSNGVINNVGTAGKAPAIRGSFIAATGNPAGTGGWALTTAGTLVAFGKAPALKGAARGAVAIQAAPSGRGVWAVMRDGSTASFGDAPQLGSSGIARAAAIVASTPSMMAKAVTINSITDFHGQIEVPSSGTGGAAVLKAYWDQAATRGTVINASVGDNIGAAPPISAQFDELPTILALNAMGLDVSTFGNHEHDKNLAHLQSMIDASKFKWAVSNYSTFDSLKGVAPYVMIERGGMKVAFVGSNTLKTPEVAPPANLGSIKIQDPATGLNAAIADARKAGAQFVVALVHNGFAEFPAGQATAAGPLLDIAKAVRGADLVLGGDSHLKYAGRVNGTAVAQSVNSSASFVQTQMCMDASTGKVLGVAPLIVAPVAKNVTPNAAVAAVVKEYADKIATKFDTKIGTVTGVFPFGGTPAVQRQGEVAIGNFIADAVRAKYNTDIAIVNGGGIRANIPALGYKPKATGLSRPADATGTGTYDVLLGDIYTVLPFGNQLATTSVTGAQIWSAMENGVSQYEAVAGRFPQISGFKFTFDVSKKAGSRVVSVTLNDGTAVPNDASKSYTLTTLDYMITGGDGYTQFNPTKSQIRDLYAQVVVDAILAKPAITIPALDGRIKKL